MVTQEQSIIVCLCCVSIPPQRLLLCYDGSLILQFLLLYYHSYPDEGRDASQALPPLFDPKDVLPRHSKLDFRGRPVTGRAC